MGVCPSGFRHVFIQIKTRSVAAGFGWYGMRPPAANDTVQNAAARLVFDLCHRDHVSPYLMQLHWLPSGHECSLNSAHCCTPFRTKDLCCTSLTLYWLLRQPLLAAVFDNLPLQTMSCRVHFPSSANGPSRMQIPPSRSYSSPVHTYNLQKTFENVFIRWSF